MRFKIMMGLILHFSIATMASASNDRSLCGLTDDRIPSAQRKVARLVAPNSLRYVCTASLVGKSCLITAGHCTKSMYIAQFNLRSDGTAAANDTYIVNRNTISYNNNAQGNDYAVFKVNRNQHTGRFPGEVHGYYRVKFERPIINSTLSVTGYGKAKDPKKNFVQHSHSGKLIDIYQSIVMYTVDTENGNSGSGLVLNQTNEIIGVHTNGGCSAYNGHNSGTLIYGNSRFAKAIQDCLASE